MMDLAPGRKIREYVLGKRIGSGAVGEVWTARHEILLRTVALKAIKPELLSSQEMRYRYLHEGQAQAKLDHPNIVRLHDSFVEEDERAYLILQFVDGGSLQDRIDRSGALPFGDVKGTALDILEALDYAHQAGVVHRDVKPSNILLSASHRAYLGDFGIALVLGEQRTTRVGTLLGTALYMSPEQIETPRLVDRRTDVYAMGCILFEMLTGRPPFGEDESNEFLILKSHVEEFPPALREIDPNAPEEMELIVERALAKDPGERFQTCGEFAAAIRDAAPDALLICPVCGTQPSPGARFCRECGSTLDEETEAQEFRQCLNCGNLLHSSADYCIQCGVPSTREKRR